MKRAIIVGSGPNGLSAAIVLARAGIRVSVLETAAIPGGSVRSEPLTLPGFVHDAGASVFPFGAASPLFRKLSLHAHGLRWVEPEIPLAHPLANGDAVAQFHDLQATADLLQEDGATWTRLFAPMLDTWPALVEDTLAPVTRLPRHPVALGRFGLHALRSAQQLAQKKFRTQRARTLFAGLAGHANIPLHFAASAAPALMLAAAAHTSGWPFAMGGAGAITAALASYLMELGGEIVLDHEVTSLTTLQADAILLDVTPSQLLGLISDQPLEEQAALRHFQTSPGTCKVDWALSAPIPWTSPLCRRAGTVHIGADLNEIASSEADAWNNQDNQRPYLIVTQPSLFDPTRAPAGRHTAWAYCHVPRGSSQDLTSLIEDQLERYAPGFRQTILARHTRTAQQLQTWNANLIGGDISGGAMTLRQIVRRPTLPPYRTSLPHVFLCSSSTPPGGGVHGMCGYHAACAAARFLGVPSDL